MEETTNNTTEQTHVEKPNVIEQYKAYIAERSEERNMIRERMAADAARLKEINEELDGEKTTAKNIVSLLVRNRKTREDKSPKVVDENGEPKPAKKRGRPSKADKAKQEGEAEQH